MVKRPKSPEIIEEVRYFTVCQPFPLNANWLFPEDQKDCATWIAECIGLEHLYAIHHKPSARGMILLEVSKLFEKHERLLGEHRWSEILNNPDEEEEKRVSQVFHSFYAKGRDAQKDGWKSLVVNASWFKKWSPGKGRFKQPYPPNHWCPVPVEDQTNKPLCRPIPVDKMRPPPRVEPPVVGSKKWIEDKNSSKLTLEALKMSYDEDISLNSVEAVNKVIERAQAKLNAGPSSAPFLNERSSTTRPSTDPFYPPLAAPISPPKKIQASRNLEPLGKNKKKAKPTPLSQFIGDEGGKKSTPATWNKVAQVPKASVVLNASPKSTSPANAWDKPITGNFKSAPAVVVKKETPSEDYSSWGQEAATPSVDQENIWKSPPTPKKSKKGKGRADSETPPASSTSQASTQPSSPQVRNIPTPTISSSFTRDVPPHLIHQFPEEEDDSDCEDIYVPFSGMNISDINDLEPEEMEDAYVNAWERGNAVNSADSDFPVPEDEDRRYQNLWLSEDDPRAVPTPAEICPVHHLACKKGICEDMSKILKDKKKAELKAKWEMEKKKKGKKKKKVLGSDDGQSNAVEDEVDEDNFKVVTRPKGKRIREDSEPSFTGRMRAFPDDPVSSDQEPDTNGEASGSGPKVSGTPEAERQLFDQW